MRALKAKEKYTRSAKVEGAVVTFGHSTLHKASDTNYVLTTGFDFTDVSQETILRLAGETMLIRWRTAFKGAEKVDETADNTVVNVKKALAGKKPKMSVDEKRDALINKLSVDERKALLAKLMEQLASDDGAKEEGENEGESDTE